MDDLPKYSAEARDVLDVFHQDYVAAIFFFEDANHESVYERLLRRLLPSLKDYAVVCLGGKTKLIAKAKESRPRDVCWIFVLDKDYDDLLGMLVSLSNVYYLRAFSIENYLVQLQAFLEISVELRPRELTLADAVKKTARFSAYLERLHARMEEIARLFVVARRYRVEIETSKMRVDEMLNDADEDEPVPEANWIKHYRTRLQASAHGANEWLADDAALQTALDDAFVRDKEVDFPNVGISDHLCGKHILGCAIRFFERALCVDLRGLDPVELYLRVVGHATLDRLEFLSEQIAQDHPEILHT